MKMYTAIFCSFFLIATFLSMSCIRKKSVTGPESNEISKWVLTWSDEFDGESIDLTKWSHMIGDGTDYGEQPGWGNNEQQYYTDDPANSGIMLDDEGDSVLFIEANETQIEELEYT
ncbi:hypothetical protein HQ585_16845, partial [candidate division KSB1 bacterium]|nr:hypothetical protein [candidate division KSB1 bacterium]